MPPIIENKFIEDKPRWARKKKSNHSQKSPSVEKPFETTDYESANGVFDKGYPYSHNGKKSLAHSDSSQRNYYWCKDEAKPFSIEFDSEFKYWLWFLGVMLLGAFITSIGVGIGFWLGGLR